MNTLDRYLIRWLLVGYLLTAAILVSIFGLLELLEQLDDVGQMQYSYVDAFAYTGYSLPRYFSNLIPFIALIGTVTALSMLTMNNELVAMRIAGITPRRITLVTLSTGLGLVMINLFFEQFVAPWTDARAFDLRAHAFQQYENLGGGLGLWARSSGEIVHVGALQHGRMPVDVEVFQIGDDGNLSHYIHAARARVERSDRWVLEDVVYKHLERRAIDTQRLDQYIWQPLPALANFKNLVRPIESLSLVDLYTYIDNIRDTGLSADRFRLIFWEKFGRLIMLLAMILIAVQTMIKSPQAQMSGIIILVILGMLVFALVEQIIGNTALLLNLPPAIAALSPEILLLAVGLLLLRQGDWS